MTDAEGTDDLEADDAVDAADEADDDDDPTVDEDDVDDGPATDDGNGDSEASTAAAVLDFLVRNLVDNPDDVRVERVHRSGGVQLEVRVADGDLGRVIGRRGRTASAIRTVTRAAAARDGVDVNVEFVD